MKWENRVKDSKGSLQWLIKPKFLDIRSDRWKVENSKRFFRNTAYISSVQKSRRKFRGSRESEVAGPFLPCTHRKGRGVQVRSIDLAEMAAASRNWKPCRERVGKLLPGMSAGLLTNRRKETTWEEIRESIAGEKSPGRVMKSRGFFLRESKTHWLAGDAWPHKKFDHILP